MSRVKPASHGLRKGSVAKQLGFLEAFSISALVSYIVVVWKSEVMFA